MKKAALVVFLALPVVAKGPARPKKKPAAPVKKEAPVVLPLENPYNLFHMMAAPAPEPANPAALPKGAPSPRPLPVRR